MCRSGTCIAWRGVAWRGVAWRGVAWRGVAWHGMAWHGMAWHGMAFILVLITKIYLDSSVITGLQILFFLRFSRNSLK